MAIEGGQILSPSFRVKSGGCESELDSTKRQRMGGEDWRRGLTVSFTCSCLGHGTGSEGLLWGCSGEEVC